MVRDRTCIQNGQIVCVDDLCHGTSQTICGLEQGTDFDVEDEFDDDYPWGDDDA